MSAPRPPRKLGLLRNAAGAEPRLVRGRLLCLLLAASASLGEPRLVLLPGAGCGAGLAVPASDIIDAALPHTMLSRARLLFNVRAVLDVSCAAVPGALVEVGVWRGGSVVSMLLTLRALGDPREVHLFDTFSGMTAPEAGVDSHRGEAAAELLERDEFMRAVAPLDAVRAAVAGTGYPPGLVHFHVGPVEGTPAGDVPPVIAYLRLDTDWYASTRWELANMHGAVPPGGVVVQDDYGFWAGAKRAVDEFLATRPELRPSRLESSVHWRVPAAAPVPSPA